MHSFVPSAIIRSRNRYCHRERNTAVHAIAKPKSTRRELRINILLLIPCFLCAISKGPYGGQIISRQWSCPQCYNYVCWKAIDTMILIKNTKSKSYSLRICGSKIGNFGGIFGILWDFFDDLFENLRFFRRFSAHYTPQPRWIPPQNVKGAPN